MSETTLEMAKAIAYDPKWIIASQSEHTRLEEKTVQWACAQIKKPNVFLEYGPMTFMPDDLMDPLETSIAAIMNAMRWAKVLEGNVTVPKYWRRTPYYTHVRAKHNGVMHVQPCMKLNNMAKEGELLVTIEDFLGNEVEKMPSPHDGVVLSIPQQHPHVDIGGGPGMIGRTPIIIKP